MAITVVAAIIQDEAGNYLCCKRGSWKSSPGKWEFPGGKAEATESLEEALIREIKEELNTDISVLRQFDRSTTGEIELVTFACELLEAKPLFSTDHDQMLWVPEGELSKLDWAEPDVPALKKLLIPFC